MKGPDERARWSFGVGGDGKVGQKATPGLVPGTDMFVDSKRFAPITRRGTKTSEDVATHSLCERARSVLF